MSRRAWVSTLILAAAMWGCIAAVVALALGVSPATVATRAVQVGLVGAVVGLLYGCALQERAHDRLRDELARGGGDSQWADEIREAS